MLSPVHTQSVLHAHTIIHPREFVVALNVYRHRLPGHAAWDYCGNLAPVHQDIIFPLVCDERFPEDTLWIIMEEDMEFYPPECNASAVSGVSGSSLPPLGSQPTRAEPSAALTESRAAENELVTDIVKICNEAHRLGKGDFIWLGYNVPDKDRMKPNVRPKLGFGSQCIAVTRAAATSLGRILGFGFWKPHHIDMELKRWFLDHRFCQGKTCMLWPPLGSFRSHESECVPKMGVRVGGWTDPLRCPFARPQHDPRKRDKQLIHYPEGGVSLCIKLMDEHWFDNCAKTRPWSTYKRSPEPSVCNLTKRRKRELRKQKQRTQFRCFVDSSTQALQIRIGVVLVHMMLALSTGTFGIAGRG